MFGISELCCITAGSKNGIGSAALANAASPQSWQYLMLLARKLQAVSAHTSVHMSLRGA